MPLQLKGTLKPGEADRRYYMIREQVSGRRVVLSTGTRDKATAERARQAVIDALRIDPATSKETLVALVSGRGSMRHRAALRADAAVTLGDAAERCLRDPEVWGRVKGGGTQRINIGHVVAFFGRDAALGAITKERIAEYVEARRKKGNADGTIKRQLTCLARLLKEALEWPNGITKLPKFPKLKPRGARKFTLTLEQEEALLRATARLDDVRPGPAGGQPRKADAYRYALLFSVLVESGLRLSEALNLRHGDLDYNDPQWAGLIRLWRTEELKNGKARTVPMTARCREALEECSGVPGGPFADLKARRAQDIFRRAADEAGIYDADCVIHALRHTCGTRLLKSSGNLKLVQEWLGHSTIAITAAVYAHVDVGMLAEGAGALDRFRDG